MCGLVGVAGKLGLKDEQLMKRLFLFDYFRGRDSTGLAAVRSNGDVKIAKLASHPLDLFEMPKFSQALAGYSSTAFIGHNRAATRGVVSTFNAHPYQFDHIVGAHNGTLDLSSAKELEEAIGESYPVDSMAVFAAIAKIGITETVKLLRGAWALTWYDASDDSLNFLRNKERPFYYAYSKDFKRVIWASEWPMIQASIKLSDTPDDIFVDDKGHCYFPTEINMHYKFYLEDLLKAETLPKPLVKELKGKEPLPVATQDPFPAAGGGRQQSNHTHSSGTKTNTQGGSTQHSFKKTSQTDPRVIELVGDNDNPYAGVVDREKFEAVAKYGCSYCSASITWGDMGITYFERDDVMLCNGCSKGDDTPRIYTRDIKSWC